MCRSVENPGGIFIKYLGGKTWAGGNFVTEIQQNQRTLNILIIIMVGGRSSSVQVYVNCFFNVKKPWEELKKISLSLLFYLMCFMNFGPVSVVHIQHWPFWILTKHTIYLVKSPMVVKMFIPSHAFICCIIILCHMSCFIVLIYLFCLCLHVCGLMLISVFCCRYKTYLLSFYILTIFKQWNLLP